MRPKQLKFTQYAGAVTLMIGLGATVFAVPLSAANTKPNILVIMGDDIGVPNISAYRP